MKKYYENNCVLTELFHLRYFKNTGLNPSEIIKVSISKKEAHTYDADHMRKFTNV